MIVNYLFLDENNICFEAPAFDTEINNGEVPDFIKARADIKRIITTYRGPVYLGWEWDDVKQELFDPNPPPPAPETPNTPGPTVIG